ncbi:TonB-dependent receptor plug domain-containing protein [Litoribrevibacter euphylliae]|uniref:TonB-dependent receptor plug domain-containing protein n=1 Tax=Litoribrevibacter euphylliae TaxID=1834034 RepID=A0ABV7HBK3_9GAMM
MLTGLCKPWEIAVLTLAILGIVDRALGDDLYSSDEDYFANDFSTNDFLASDETDDFEALLELPIEELMEVEVTGSTMTSKSIVTAPSSVTVFNQQRIKELGVDKLHELANYVPGFQSYLSSGWSHNHSISVRGRRISSALTDVLLLIDGHRINNARTGGASSAVPTFPLSQVERVEFIRGPGASIYGSNAMIGVINIITRKNANQATLAYGTHNRKTADLLVNDDLGSIEVSLVAHHDSDNGETYDVISNNTQSIVELRDKREFSDIIFNLAWQQTEVNLQYYENASKGYFLEGSTPDKDNRRESNLFSARLNQGFDWLSVDSNVSLEYQLSHLTLHGQVQEQGTFNLLSDPPSDAPLMTDVNFDDIEGYRVFWLNNWPLSDRQSFQFGTEYRFQKVRKTYAKSNFDIAALAEQSFPIASSDTMSIPTLVQEATTRDIWGLFGQYQHDITHATQLTLGLRYDRYASIGSEVSPRASLVHSFNNHHSIKLTYGRAFRAPAENELFLVNNPVIVGNPDLKPETVSTWEAVWLAQWQQTFISLGYFENHFTDSILLAPSDTGKLVFDNVRLKDSRGMELELHHHFNARWSSRLTAMHLFNNAQESFKEADTVGSISINYHQPNWQANLSSVYQGARETVISNSDRIKLNDYWLLNGKLAYQWTSEWSTNLQIKNLLDKSYDTPNNNAPMNNPVPNRGREFLASVSYQF